MAGEKILMKGNEAGSPQLLSRQGAGYFFGFCTSVTPQTETGRLHVQGHAEDRRDLPAGGVRDRPR